jgi:hypothetical protein
MERWAPKDVQPFQDICKAFGTPRFYLLYIRLSRNGGARGAHTSCSNAHLQNPG